MKNKEVNTDLKTYSISQVAELLGVKSGTVRRWVKSGELSYMQVKEKGNILIRESELIRFMDSFTVYT